MKTNRETNTQETEQNGASCAIQPWIDNPYRLVSWLDMLQFSAHEYYQLGSFLKALKMVAEEFRDKPAGDPHKDFTEKQLASVSTYLDDAHAACSKLGLAVSMDVIDKSRATIKSSMTYKELVRGTDMISTVLHSEMKQHLSFWIPPERAKWYGKTGLEILGPECGTYFATSGILREAEESSKSFTFGRYTASAFHLMRVTEAGVKAFGIALGVAIPPGSFNWGTKVFDKFDSQYSKPPKDRDPIWQTHAEFFKSIGGNLKAVKNAWRNNIAHLEDTYNEDQAAHLLAVIPAFMREIASRLDEGGNWH